MELWEGWDAERRKGAFFVDPGAGKIIQMYIFAVENCAKYSKEESI